MVWEMLTHACSPSVRNGTCISDAHFCGHAGIGPFSEVAFFHRPSRTLLVTDAVISVPERAPEVVREASLLEAGGPLPASVRALSGGDAESPTEEIFAQSTEQQLQLGRVYLAEGVKTCCKR